MVKNNNQSIFPPKEEFERVVKRARESNQRTNIILAPNATAVEKAKYNLCKSIACYERENNLTEKELAKRLGITHFRVEKILFCHIDKLNLEELINFIERLSMPLEIKVNSKNVWKKISPQAH